MPTIDQVYRDNLQILASEAGGPGKLADRLGKSPAQVSQWLNASKDSKTGKPRSMSRAMARFVEARFDKPLGWMDQPHAEGVQEPLADYAAAPPPPPPPGGRFDALSEEEQRFIDNLREIVDEDERRHLLEEVATKAAKMRALREKLLAPYGITVATPRHHADAKRTALAKAALDVTERLRQRSLFEGPKGDEDDR